ncbi:MAG TPA: TolC family outer membrane protein [Paenalcaligenes sp.]|nr:TolC family outer membrane protein [Paenalcaligenes sp.]
MRRPCARQQPRWRALLISVCLLLLAPTVHALDLWTAWHYALQHNPSYAAAQASSAADQHLIAQARAELLPQIHANAGLEHQDRRNLRDFGHRQGVYNNLWALSLTQPLFNRQNLQLYEHAQLLAAMAVIDEQNSRTTLMLQVSEAYFDSLMANATLRSLLAEREAVKKQYEAAVRAFELGSATITDAQEARSRFDLLQAQIINAENDLQQRFFALEKIMGKPPFELAPLKKQVQLPQPEPNDPRQWQHRAAEHNLQVHKADLSVQAQQAMLASSKSLHDPTISLQARTGSQRRPGGFGATPTHRPLDSSIGIELSIPLYTGGGISARVKEESERLRQRHFEREEKRRTAVEQAQRYFSAVTSGLLEIRSLEAAEQSSRSALQANQRAYEIGVRTLVDVLNAQRQLYDTQRSLDHSRYRVLLDGLRLKDAAGLLTEEDLWAVNQLLDIDDRDNAIGLSVASTIHEGSLSHPPAPTP